MRVKLGCWIVLLIVACLAIAEEVSKDLNEEIESDTETFGDVLYQNKKCQSDKDCRNSGKCEAKEDSTKYCNCKKGTSGDSCEIVDDCATGLVKCGVQKDASCVFDVQLERAVCKCDNESKTYVPEEGRCMSPCGYVNSCVHGDCFKIRIGDRYFCQCDDGATGDFCEIVEECQNKVVDCGTDPSTVCALRSGGHGHAYCKCSNPELGFDYDHKICKECDCGSEAPVCEFKEGKKMCSCKDGYIPVGPDKVCTQMCNYTNPCQNGGTCSQKVCSCLNGTSGDLCKTIDGCSSRCGRADCFYNVTSRDIYCKCNNRYAFDDYNKMCRACDCGTYQKSCSYVDGKKKCTCVDVIYADRLGTCAFCYCKGYASMYGCKFDDRGAMKCKCLRGYAQQGDECKRCDCGIHGNCTLYGWGSKSCTCEKGYAEKYGTCEECDCGENGTCRFSFGGKVCQCDYGFKANHQGTCKECDCGDFSKKCEFDSYGNKVCTCIDGYALKSGVCTPCNCNRGTSCIFKNELLKECICPHGYANFFGTCRECDCKMVDSNCTMDTGLRECQCPKGFESSGKTFEMFPTCIDIDECHRPQDNDCPFSTRCVNKWGSYDCVCKEGFEVINKYGGNDIKRDGCKDIDECRDYSACIDIHALCVNTPGSYRCDCKDGYSVERDSYKEKYNFCSEGYRPWRIASIVVGCLFGFVIFGLLIAIFNKHCDT